MYCAVMVDYEKRVDRWCIEIATSILTIHNKIMTLYIMRYKNMIMDNYMPTRRDDLAFCGIFVNLF